jgi:asparaginyl-tRNA synthetase
VNGGPVALQSDRSIVRISDLHRREGEIVKLRGWVYAVRSSGKISFLQFRDGTGICQLIATGDDMSGEECDLASHIGIETSVEVEGEARVDSRAPGGVEVILKRFKVIGESEDYPIGRKEHGPDFLLDNRHLWLRSPRQAAILRIRSSVELAARLFLHDEGFFEFNSPILTPTACEETTQLFEVDYFGLSAYLTQSGQLYSEAGITALERVYCFGPSFRAEKSKTRKHLTEFWIVEPEMAWFDAEDNMAFQERFIKAISAYVAERNEKDLALLKRKPEDIDLADKSFEIITYDDAVKGLKADGFGTEWGKDFGAEEEAHLVKKMGTPFFIYKYPVEARAFYIERDPADDRLALSSDTFLHGDYGSEICTGGQRSSSVEFLEAQIRRLNLNLKDYEWYLDIRRYGSVPHSGFGLGIERTVRWICGLHHVRETIPFPRMLKRLSP